MKCCNLKLGCRFRTRCPLSTVLQLVERAPTVTEALNPATAFSDGTRRSRTCPSTFRHPDSSRGKGEFTVSLKSRPTGLHPDRPCTQSLRPVPSVLQSRRSTDPVLRIASARVWTPFRRLAVGRTPSHGLRSSSKTVLDFPISSRLFGGDDGDLTNTKILKDVGFKQCSDEEDRVLECLYSKEFRTRSTIYALETSY